MSTVTNELIESLKTRLPDQEDRLMLERLRAEIDDISRGSKPETVDTASSQDSIGTLNSRTAANWRWAFAAREAGELEQYAGRHVVVSDEQVVSADRDANAAIRQAEMLTGVPRSDLAVLYVDPPGAEGWFDVG